MKRERTLSLKQIDESRAKAARVREKLTREPLRGRTGSGRERYREEGEGSNEEDEATSPKRRKVVIEVVEQDSEVKVENEISERLVESGVEHEHAHMSEMGVVGHDFGGREAGVEEMEARQLEDSDEVSNYTQSVQCSGGYQESYVIAVHRRLVSAAIGI